MEVLKQIEEQGIDYPSTSHDIPEHCRVRLHTVAFYWQVKLQRIEYLRFPYDGHPESAFIPHSRDSDVKSRSEYAEAVSALQPNVMYGPSYGKYLSPIDGSTSILTSSKFHFLIPKVRGGTEAGCEESPDWKVNEITLSSLLRIAEHIS